MGGPPRVPVGHRSQNKNSEATERNCGGGKARKQSDRRVRVVLVRNDQQGHRKTAWATAWKYGGGGVGPGARLERYYVCLRATCHPPLTLTTHRMPRPLPQTDAWLRLSLFHHPLHRVEQVKQRRHGMGGLRRLRCISKESGGGGAWTHSGPPADTTCTSNRSSTTIADTPPLPPCARKGTAASSSQAVSTLTRAVRRSTSSGGHHERSARGGNRAVLPKPSLMVGPTGTGPAGVKKENDDPLRW